MNEQMQPTSMDPETKPTTHMMSPILTAVMGLIVPGAGQISISHFRAAVLIAVLVALYPYVYICTVVITSISAYLYADAAKRGKVVPSLWTPLRGCQKRLAIAAYSYALFVISAEFSFNFDYASLIGAGITSIRPDSFLNVIEVYFWEALRNWPFAFAIFAISMWWDFYKSEADPTLSRKYLLCQIGIALVPVIAGLLTTPNIRWTVTIAILIASTAIGIVISAAANKLRRCGSSAETGL